MNPQTSRHLLTLETTTLPPAPFAVSLRDPELPPDKALPHFNANAPLWVFSKAMLLFIMIQLTFEAPVNPADPRGATVHREVKQIVFK